MKNINEKKYITKPEHISFNEKEEEAKSFFTHLYSKRMFDHFVAYETANDPILNREYFAKLFEHNHYFYNYLYQELSRFFKHYSKKTTNRLRCSIKVKKYEPELNSFELLYVKVMNSKLSEQEIEKLTEKARIVKYETFIKVNARRKILKKILTPKVLSMNLPPRAYKELEFLADDYSAAALNILSRTYAEYRKNLAIIKYVPDSDTK